MKKIIFSALLAVLIVPGLASAQTAGEIQTQISALLAQIAALQQQLESLQEKPVAWCHTFNVNLKIGDSREEVGYLRTALAKEGFLGLEAMGGAYEFDETVASAVSEFQEKYVSEILQPYGLKRGTGYVGPSTRKKLNSLYGCGVTAPSITVLSPNGGEQFTTGLGPYTIAWKQSQNTGVSVWIRNKTLPSQPQSDMGYYMKTIKGEFNGQAGKNVYGWVVTNDIPIASGYEVCVAGYFNVGFERPAMQEDCGNAAFSIISSATANQPPVIDSVSGPTTLSAGQTGTWTIKAHDPENNQMSYFVIWGDEEDKSLLYALDNLRSFATAFSQTTSITHLYSKAGIYNPTFVIYDSAGLSAKTSISVNVGAVPVAVGTLGIYLNLNTPQSQGVIMGTFNNPFTTIKFSANQEEDIKISQIKITRIGGTDADISKITLWDGATKIGQAFLGEKIPGMAVFNFSSGSEIRVPKSSYKTIAVRADISDYTLARSGDAVKLVVKGPGDAVIFGEYNSDTVAYGVSSGKKVDLTGDAWGNYMYLFRTLPAVSLNSSSPSGSQTVGANQEVFRFNVANVGLLNLEIKSITFAMLLSNPSNINGKAFKLYSTSDFSTAIASSAASSTATGASLTLTPSSGNIIGGPSSPTFALKGDTSQMTGSLTVSIDANNFLWSDGATTTFLGVSGLPITGGTLVYSSVVPTTTPSITVLSPNGGEQYQAGQATQMPLKWEGSCDISSFGISLYKSGVFVKTMISDVPSGICSVNQLSLPYYTTWPIPSTLQAGSDYKIRVSSDSGKTLDDSNVLFSITVEQKLDYNNDAKLDTSDADKLANYWTNKTCPADKICDVNRDGVFTVADVQKLTNITLGTASVPDYKTSLLESNPQKLDYNNDGKLDTNDSYILTDVFLGKRSCPSGKVCDVNQDGKIAAISDVQKFTNIILGTTPVPDFGSQPLGSASLNPLASALEALKGIMEQLAGFLR